MIKLTEAEYHRANDAMEGRCLACGDVADGVEPDAERYKCVGCGEFQVYGVEQLLMLGKLDIVEDS